MIRRLASPLINWHNHAVRAPRQVRLAEAIAGLVQPPKNALDIGCGDAKLSLELATRWNCDMTCVDMAPHPHPRLPVTPMAGSRLPYTDGSFDVAILSDVLHHASDARSLLREALRVVRRGGFVLVKDHVCYGPWSRPVLRAMDFAGNIADGIPVNGRYYSDAEWGELLAAAGARIDRRVWPVVIHDLPWRWVARSEYQVLLRLCHADSTL